MSNPKTKPRPPKHSPDLAARLWVLAGLLGITASVAAMATGRFSHLSASAEALIAIGVGWLTMLGFAPWRLMKRYWIDRAEIRKLTRCLRQINRTHRRAPLRTLLSGRTDDLGELSREIHNALTTAAGHRIQAQLLRRTMDHSIRRETHRAAGHLRRQAATDPLTGLGNRRALHERLAQLLDAAARNARPLSALMIDIDRFKQINDMLGHQAGDACLAFLGKQLQSGLRRGDCAFRTGGDEFVVLIPSQGIATAKIVAERICAQFRRLPWPHPQPSRPSLSIGVASAMPDELAEPGELIRRADEAMYAAKRSGRARIATDNDLRGAA